MRKWKSLGSKIVYKSPFMDFYEYQVERPNGKILPYYCVNKAPACIVIPVDGEHTFVIKQFRFAANRISWEFPGGGADLKNPKKSAENELVEETGLRAQNVKLLGSFFINAGYSNQQCFVYSANGLTHGNVRHESTEFLEVHRITFKEFEAKITSGDVIDSSSISAFYLFKAMNA